MQKMNKRKKIKAKKEENKEEVDDDESVAISDNYDGFGVDLFKQHKPAENKILDKTFLGELKVVDVKDSDDEEYF